MSQAGSAVSGGGGGGGIIILNYTSVDTTPYIATANDEVLGVDSSSISITIELPDAPSVGRSYIVKDVTGDCHAHNITVTSVGGAVLFDGASSQIMNTDYEALQFLFNGTGYIIL